MKAYVEACLDDICTIIMEQSPPSSAYNSKQEGLPFFQGKAEFTELHPVTVKWCTAPTKIAEANDILLSVRAPVGTTNIADQKCCIGRGLAALRYIHCYKFLFYYLRLIEKKLDEKGTGTTFRAISGDVLRNYPINLPPLPEQRAIVAKLEQLFSELDNGIACLKKAQELLKVYRQSVLKQAFEGELTKAWREQQTSLPSAQELLETIKDEREQSAKLQGKKLKSVMPLTRAELDVLPELPDGWRWRKVDEVSSHVVDCLHSTAKFVDHGYYCIDTTCIEDGKINFKKVRFVDQNTYNDRISRLKPVAGDLLFAREGTVGTTVIVPDKIELCLGQRMMMFRPSSTFHSAYLMYFFQSILFKKQYLPLISGTTSPHLNIRDIVQLKVPHTSQQEQHQIIQEIETRLSVCDNIESTIRESLEKAEALRQSILKKAFEGKLLSEEELQITRSSPDWEPAEKLLERIRAEKQTARNKH